jgi:hypothetical protein
LKLACVSAEIGRILGFPSFLVFFLRFSGLSVKCIPFDPERTNMRVLVGMVPQCQSSLRTHFAGPCPVECLGFVDAVSDEDGDTLERRDFCDNIREKRWVRLGPDRKPRNAQRCATAMKELESAFAILLYVIVFGSPVWIPLAIYVYHQRKNPPVQVMSIEALMAAGF